MYKKSNPSLPLYRSLSRSLALFIFNQLLSWNEKELLQVWYLPLDSLPSYHQVPTMFYLFVGFSVSFASIINFIYSFCFCLIVCLFWSSPPDNYTFVLFSSPWIFFLCLSAGRSKRFLGNIAWSMVCGQLRNNRKQGYLISSICRTGFPWRFHVK